MEEKMRFVLEAEEGARSFAALCRRFGISRVTGYKWAARYRESGLEGLKERSRAPGSHPNATPGDVREEVVQMRRKYPRWGPKKIRRELLERGVAAPAASTIGDILSREGLTVPRRRRRRVPRYQGDRRAAERPNQVWSADFKGWFRTGDRRRCEPLTVMDQHSRYLIRCRLVKRPSTLRSKAVFEAAFREWGLPEAILTDNGTPFASAAVAGLSSLSVWWIRLGILPMRIRPGHPEENGAHERMHRTLKECAADPPCVSWPAQQRELRRFQRFYNEVRPHEALGQRPPRDCYQPSPRPWPEKLPEAAYPEGWPVRRVVHRGTFSWKGTEVFLSETLNDQSVGLQPLEQGLYRIHLCAFPVAVFDPRRARVLTPSEAAREGESGQGGTVNHPPGSPGGKCKLCARSNL